MKTYLCLTWFVVAIASGMCLAQSDKTTQAPSLAELARKQHHGKNVTEKVFTDEDLPPPSAPPQSQSTPAIESPSMGRADTAEKTQAASDKIAKTDAAPAKKSDATSERKKRLDRYTTERDAWKQAAKRYEELLATEKDEFRRQIYEDALSKDRHDAELYQAKIDEMQASQNKAQQDATPDAQQDVSAGGGHR